MTKEHSFKISDIFNKSDMATKISFVVMGFGCMAKGQLVKGLLLLATEIAYIGFMIFSGISYLSKITTLGTATQVEVYDAELEIYKYMPGDNSMLILLFSVLTIFITIFFVFIYLNNIKAAYLAQLIKASGKTPPTFKEDFKSLFDKNFHTTLLTLPSLGVIAFTVLPLIFMVLIAFTNFDRNHQPPGNLFTWIGFENFKNIFWANPLQSSTFAHLLGWTLIWAFFATFSNYILGMILAMMINKKGIRFKQFFRTVFVITIAVPQFVTLLLMSKLLNDLGPVNVILQNWGLIEEPIRFLSNGDIAKVVIILVNIWVGIPYTMLITTGILLNIPEDLYESARIDGAGIIPMFTKITLPYMLFVTTPYLITQFIGNINNFNVIWLLTGGGPASLDYFQAGQTDLLVTWLYKLTVNEQNYNLASTIGILIFLLSAAFSLVLYNQSASVKKEDELS